MMEASKLPVQPVVTPLDVRAANTDSLGTFEQQSPETASTPDSQSTLVKRKPEPAYQEVASPPIINAQTMTQSGIKGFERTEPYVMQHLETPPPEVKKPGLATRLLRMVSQYWASMPKLTSSAQLPSTPQPPATNVEVRDSPLAVEPERNVPVAQEVGPPVIPSAPIVQPPLAEVELATPAAETEPEEDISAVVEADVSAAFPTVVVDQNIQAALEDYALSKNQQSLTEEEGKLWDMLAESIASEDLPESLTRYAEDLEAKSSVLSESYQRRTNAPTQSTYYESREILGAMGIPCIEPSGAFEGEALAASLVMNGHADYVASEDMVRSIDSSRSVSQAHFSA